MQAVLQAKNISWNLSIDMSALTILLFAFPACFSEVGFDYPRNDASGSPTKNQTTIEDCRKYCRGSCTSCNYFTHVSAGDYEGWCWCKTSKATRTSHANLGTAITSGEICQQMGECIILTIIEHISTVGLAFSSIHI